MTATSTGMTGPVTAEDWRDAMEAFFAADQHVLPSEFGAAFINARLATRTEPPARGEDVAWEPDARTVEMCAKVAERLGVEWKGSHRARTIAAELRALTPPSAKGDGL